MGKACLSGQNASPLRLQSAQFLGPLKFRRHRQNVLGDTWEVWRFGGLEVWRFGLEAVEAALVPLKKE
jgi:hypothetical protein